jgi:hypothetical protein
VTFIKKKDGTSVDDDLQQELDLEKGLERKRALGTKRLTCRAQSVTDDKVPISYMIVCNDAMLELTDAKVKGKATVCPVSICHVYNPERVC